MKAANVLLDDDFNPKLSDFGLAKLGPVGDNTHVSTRVMGTYGYCAPDYAMSGKLTLKSDVYSFGVLLLELITGRRAFDSSKIGGQQKLMTWSRPFLGDRRKFHQLADPFLQGRYPPRPFHQLVVIASMCLQEQPHVRPIITDVVVALNHVASQPYTLAPDSKIMSSPPPPLPSSGRVTARERFVVLQDPALVDQPLLLHGHVAAPGDHGLERLDRRVDRRLDGELGAVGAAYVNGGGGRPATVVGIAVVGHGRRRPGLGDRGIPNTTAISDGERERVKKRDEDGMADDGDQDWGIVESLTQPRVVSDGERERVKKREEEAVSRPLKSSLQLTTAAFGPVGGDDARDVGAGGRGGVGVTGVGARLDLATGGGRVADEEVPWAHRRRRALRLAHGLMAVQPGCVHHQVTALGGDSLGARGGGAAEDSPVGGGAAVAGDAAISGGGVTAAGEAQTVVQGIVEVGKKEREGEESRVPTVEGHIQDLVCHQCLGVAHPVEAQQRGGFGAELRGDALHRALGRHHVRQVHHLRPVHVVAAARQRDPQLLPHHNLVHIRQLVDLPDLLVRRQIAEPGHRDVVQAHVPVLHRVDRASRPTRPVRAPATDRDPHSRPGGDSPVGGGGEEEAVGAEEGGVGDLEKGRDGAVGGVLGRLKADQGPASGSDTRGVAGERGGGGAGEAEEEEEHQRRRSRPHRRSASAAADTVPRPLPPSL
ncbi:hypothetical protein B296_00031018 [Ensete ventricosum]|uniref:Protein kinase domain-containing protein n=1 Tax=Ensete ventricosum TaxID=4639 RepID=A0A426ZVL1_ENSVE|nr:hypothetical protein B296_00031018 [Ensete ventricosum]